jgi:hypothetical protein
LISFSKYLSQLNWVKKLRVVIALALLFGGDVGMVQGHRRRIVAGGSTSKTVREFSCSRIRLDCDRKKWPKGCRQRTVFNFKCRRLPADYNCGGVPFGGPLSASSSVSSHPPQEQIAQIRNKYGKKRKTTNGIGKSDHHWMIALF